MSIDHELVKVGPAQYTDLGWNSATPKTIVHFYMKKPLNKIKTERNNGEPVYDQKVFVKKLTPGDTTLDYDQPATQKDKDEHPQEYQAFLNNQEIQQAGVPLEAWSEMPPELIPEFKYLKVYTVNQLASLPDAAGHKIFGFVRWRQKAQEFLDSKSGSQVMEEMKFQLQDRDKKIEELTAAVKAMQDRMPVSEPVKRKPGRPKKVVSDTVIS